MITRFLNICFENRVETYRYQNNEMLCCRYRGNDSITYSNHSQSWEDYWNYILSEYLESNEFGIASIYHGITFEQAYNIVSPIIQSGQYPVYFQVNTVEMLLPELLIKKNLLQGTEAKYVAWGSSLWQVSHDKCTVCEQTRGLTPYRFTANDIVAAYFSSLPVTEQEKVLHTVFKDEKSGDLARYVNTSKITNYN